MTDPAQADQLAERAAALRWEGDYGPPTSCHREVRLVCGPDLNRDGDPEAIVQIGWWHAVDGNTCASLKSSADYWPITYTFLASKHGTSWRAVAPLGVSIFGDNQELRRTTDFVRMAPARIGIMVRWADVASDNGCQIGGYQVFAYQGGALRQVETRDDSPPCTPCCERP